MNTLEPAPAPAALHGLPPGILLLRNTPVGGRALGHFRGYHLEHLPTPDPYRQGLDILREPEIVAVTADEQRQDHEAWAALLFALHLGDHRRERALPPVPCLTIPTRPDPVPAGTVRIPHLTEAVDQQGQGTDRVIWELMLSCDVSAWLGCPLPDQTWFEDRLLALLTLGRRLREGTLPDDPACSQLASTLSGQYLSIRFAYQNPALIAEVIAVTEVEQVEPELAGVADDRR
jgi:hypothetical protein